MLKLKTYPQAPIRIAHQKTQVVNFKAMPETEFDVQAKPVIDKIRNAKTIAVFPHNNPDLDAMGSAIAFVKIAKADDPQKKLDIIYSGTIPYNTRKVMEKYPDINFIRAEKASNLPKYDLAVSLDTAVTRLMDKKAQEIFDSINERVKIDHHGGSEKFANTNLIDDTSSSNCQIMLRVAEKMGVADNPDFASAIYLGIADDTGMFKFQKENDSVSVFDSCAKLAKTGINVSSLNKDVTLMPISTFNTYRDMLGRLELSKDNRICLLELKGNTPKEARDRFLWGIQDVEGVDVAATLSQNKKKGKEVTGVSLRGENVLDIIENSGFNGGGHPNAAGCGIDKPVQEAKRLLLQAINDFLKIPQRQDPA